MCLLGVDSHNRFRMYTICTCTVNHTYAIINIINCINVSMGITKIKNGQKVMQRKT